MAEKLIVRTITGDVCILAKHIDYAAALGIGEARVTDAEGKMRIAACNSGLLSVSDNHVRVMATTFEWADEIDKERAQISLDASQEALNKADRSDANYAALEAKLKRALLRVQISE